MTEGKPAPAFDLPTEGEGQISLAGLRGQAVVLYFYPKADTPGCTTEGLDFSARMTAFEAIETVVVGVSRDPVRKLDRFKAKHDLKVTLASDEEGAACEAYGVWVEKSLYGRQYMGVERATFLIDREGIIRQVWRKVKVKDHADEVLTAARSLPGR